MGHQVASADAGLASIVSAPWVIRPEVLLTVASVWNERVDGVRLSADQIQARIGARPDAPPPYAVHDRVAVVPVAGMLGRRMNLMMDISGGSSTEIIGNTLMKAVEDSGVDAIVLNIASPGGNVDGVSELAALVRQADAQKPVIAAATGYMTSGAYWIGSAAREAYITEPTTVTGSIGVAMMHIDRSQQMRAVGIVATDIYAGKYKRIASDNKPLSDEAQAVLQAQVDKVYDVFVTAVAENRGTSKADVLNRMADGRIFIGDQAIESGLVDGMKTLGETVARARELSIAAKSTTVGHTVSTHRIARMDIKQFEAEYPDLIKQVRVEAFAQGKEAGVSEASAAAKSAIDEAREAGVSDGAKSERERIAGIEALALPGHDALIAKMKEDGTSVAAAGIAIVKAEASRQKGVRDDLNASAPQPVNHATPAEPQGGQKSPEQMRDEAKAYAAENGVSFLAAYNTLFEQKAA